MMPWLLLFVAILFEVAGITSMKLSRGFAEPIPSIAVPVFYVLSAAAVILALKRLDLSVTYAIWSGVGTALAVLIGIAYFREPFTLFKLASLGSWCWEWSACRSRPSRRTDGTGVPRYIGGWTVS
jgi:small multidrug resistance pump